MVSWVRDDIDMCPEDRWKDLACMSYSSHVNSRLKSSCCNVHVHTHSAILPHATGTVIGGQASALTAVAPIGPDEHPKRLARSDRPRLTGVTGGCHAGVLTSLCHLSLARASS